MQQPLVIDVCCLHMDHLIDIEISFEDRDCLSKDLLLLTVDHVIILTPRISSWGPMTWHAVRQTLEWKSIMYWSLRLARLT